MNTNTSRRFEIIFTTSTYKYYTNQDSYDDLKTYFVYPENSFIITVIRNHPLKNISTHDIYYNSHRKLLDMIYQEQI